MTDNSTEMYETDNIDDLLTGTTPDSQEVETLEEPEATPQAEPEDTGEGDAPEPEAASEASDDVDEYGNEQPAPRTYTEDEVNERINAAVRERLARAERNAQTDPAAAKAAQKGFEYDENSEVTWQDQLENFVKQTVSKMHTEQATQTRQAQERQAQIEFEQKFVKGMDRFADYKEVVTADKMTDAMVLATRAMTDPAAFVYAAVKRAPDDIKRIAGLADPYAQMVEMGKLEERLKKTKATTSAPRPLAKTKADMSIAHSSDKEQSIEDMIAHSERQRQAKLRDVRRR